MEVTSEQLEQLKAIELDMLRWFIAVCEKLNLKYYLLGGTLLGAVRHHGFIPWDDDIDVGMPRKDYERFIKEGQALLPENLFIQCLDTEPNYLMCFAKIRNSNTTFVESSISHLKINHGVFIDVFPLDYYPEERNKQRRVDFQKFVYDFRISYCFNLSRCSRKRGIARFLLQILRLIYPSVGKVIQKRDALYKSVPVSNYIVNYGGAWGKKEIVPADWYGQGVKGDFEGLSVTLPTCYDKWLTQVYGDYMTPPPVDKRVGHHYVDAIDLNRSYSEIGELRT